MAQTWLFEGPNDWGGGGLLLGLLQWGLRASNLLTCPHLLLEQHQPSPFIAALPLRTPPPRQNVNTVYGRRTAWSWQRDALCVIFFCHPNWAWMAVVVVVAAYPRLGREGWCSVDYMIYI